VAGRRTTLGRHSWPGREQRERKLGE
jgi:hypothetical protein